MRKIAMLFAATAIVGIGLSTVPADAADWQNAYSGSSWNNNAHHHGWRWGHHEHHWHRHYDPRSAHSWHGHDRQGYHQEQGNTFGFNFR